jgi:hypothetical protein
MNNRSKIIISSLTAVGIVGGLIMSPELALVVMILSGLAVGLGLIIYIVLSELFG